PEWADASIYAVQQADVIVSVDDVAQDEHLQHLQIKLSIKNAGKKLEVIFKGWGTVGKNIPARVEGGPGQPLSPTKIGFPAAVFTPRSIKPDETVTNWIAFEGSVLNLPSLRIELPAEAFGGYGKLRLHIPRSMMIFRAAPSVGAKTVNPLV